ncbi:MAG: type II toxin-antitoxin system ParD family antitoxin [Candidatus Hydrogenedentes bacterium]|nr:type II toxin-antitoxin system ParD family antitoxin [Candidatus Hydrogenedentota bacterium]
MTTEHIELAEEQAAFVREGIEAGRFASVSDAVNAGLHLLEARFAEEYRRQAELKKLLDDAVAGGISPRSAEEIWAAAEANFSTG